MPATQVLQGPCWLIQDRAIRGQRWYFVRMVIVPANGPQCYGPFPTREMATQFYEHARREMDNLETDLRNDAVDMCE